MRTHRSYHKPLVRLSPKQIARLQERSDDIDRLYRAMREFQKLMARVIENQIALEEDVIELQVAPANEFMPAPVRHEVH